MLDRHGLKAIFLARLLPLARTFVSLPAGARRMPLLPFIVLTTVGCAIWAAAFVVLGMLTGTAWSSVIGKVTLAVGAAVLVVSFSRRRTRRSDRSARRSESQR